MPFARNRDLPDSVKGALPTRAQSIFRNAFNNAEGEQELSEERSFQVAWGAVRNAGYERDDDGKWHKTQKATIDFPISKVDEDQNLVFGWANVSMTADGDLITDRQGDQIDIETLESAAYFFNLQFRKTGVNHTGDANGQIIESFVVTPQKLEKMGLAEDALPIGWWLGAYIEDDDVFKQVKEGELAMFSIQGRAIREPV